MTYSKEETANLHEQTFGYLLIDETEHILTVTLNRPKKKNAMNPTMVNELAYALSYAHHNSDIWAVVLAAKGTIYSAGADLRAFSGSHQEINSTIPVPDKPVIIGNLGAELYKPCIAKVHAPVYAGGLLLIGACTHVVAMENTFFSLPEVKRGLWPMQVMQSLLQIMPPRKVLDWCMRAKKMTAQEALQNGLVTELVTDEAALDKAVQQLCEELCQFSPTAIRMGLKAYHQLQYKTAGEAHEYLHKMLMQLVQTEDAIEGILAFQQKREPVWKGQ